MNNPSLDRDSVRRAKIAGPRLLRLVSFQRQIRTVLELQVRTGDGGPADMLLVRTLLGGERY